MKEESRFPLLWVAFGLGVALLIAAHEITSLPEVLQHLLKGLADALIIAVVLAKVVDEAAKRRLLTEVVENVSAYILGRLLPPELSEHIIEQHLRVDLIRTNWTITHTITEWPENSEYEQLVTHATYQMENRSLSPKPYDCIYEVESSLFPDIGIAEITSVTGTNLINRAESFDYPQQPELKPIEKDATVTFCHRVEIPVHKGPSYEFVLKSVECVRDGSIIPTFAKYPVLSTTLTVLFPVDRMNVFVDLSIGSVESGQPKQIVGGKEWTFSKPMLPGQGFTLRFVRLPK